MTFLFVIAAVIDMILEVISGPMHGYRKAWGRIPDDTRSVRL